MFSLSILAKLLFSQELYRHEIEEKQKLAEKVEELNDQSVRLE